MTRKTRTLLLLGPAILAVSVGTVVVLLRTIAEEKRHEQALLTDSSARSQSTPSSDAGGESHARTLPRKKPTRPEHPNWTDQELPLTIRARLGQLLSEYLSQISTPKARIAEYLAILNGTSAFFDLPAFQERFKGADSAVLALVLNRIQKEKHLNEDNRRLLFDGLWNHTQQALETRSLGHELASTLGSLASDLEGMEEKISTLLSSNMSNSSIATLITYMPKGKARDSQRYQEAIWAVFEGTSNEKVRDAAAWDLCSRIATVPKIMDRLTQTYMSQKESVRGAVVHGFKQADENEQEILTAAQQLLYAEQSSALKAQLLDILAKAGDSAPHNTMAFVRASLTSDSSFLRESCARFLGKKGDETDIARLRAISASDQDPDVRKAAVQAIAHLRSGE